MFKTPFSNRKSNELTDENLNAFRIDNTIDQESLSKRSTSDDGISSITTDNDNDPTIASTNMPPIPLEKPKTQPVKGAGKVKCVRKEDDGTLKIVKCNTLTDIEERDEVTNATKALKDAKEKHETATTELSSANQALAEAQTNFDAEKSKVSSLDKMSNAVTFGNKFETQKQKINEAKRRVKTAKTEFDVATKELKAAEKRLNTAETNLEKKQKILKDPIKWCFGKSMKGGGKPVSRKHRTRTFSKSRKLRGRRSVGKSSSRKIRK